MPSPLTPPLFEDCEQTRRAGVLHWLVWGMIAIMAVHLATVSLARPDYPTRWLTIAIAAIACGWVCLVLNRRGKVPLASGLIVGLLFAVGCGAAWTAGGIRATTMDFFLIAVLAAGVLLGSRAGLLVGCAAALAGLALALADYLGVLPTGSVNHTPFSLWVVLLLYIVAVILLQYLALGSIDQALKAAKEELAQRRETEEALRTSEAFRKRVFDTSRVPMVVMDAITHRFVDCNPAASDAFRHASREETLGKTPLDVSAPTQYDGASSDESARYHVEKALTEGSTQFEWRLQRPDGEVWDAAVHLMRFQDGDRQYLQFTVQDITERRRAKEALRLSYAKMQAVFDSMTDAVFTSDATGRFRLIDANEATATMFRFRSKEECPLDISSWSEILEMRMPNGDFVPQDSRPVARALRGEKVKNVEYAVRRIDTGEAWVASYSFGPIRDDHGAIVGSVSVARDVTESKRAEQALRDSEERYRTLFENCGDAIMVIRGDRHIDCNLRALELFGCETRDQIVGRSPSELSPPVQQDGRNTQDVVAELIAAAHAGRPQHFGWIHRRVDGTCFPADVTVNTMALGGEVLLQAVVRDVSERTRVEQALRVLATSFADLSGRPFFEAVSRHIATAVGIDYVFVGELNADLDEITVLGGSALGSPMGDLRIPLEGTACAAALGDQIVVHPCDARSLFPQDSLLAQIGIEGWIGAPVFDQEHRRIGILAALHTKPLPQPEVLTRYFNVFLDRISAEMRRARAEEARRESEERYRALFDRSLDGVFLTDVEGRFLDADRAILDILGYSREDIPTTRLDALVSEDQLDLALSTIAEIVTTGGKKQPTEYRLRRKDGETVILQTQSALMYRDGRPYAIQSIARDVTESRRMERELEQSRANLSALIESTSDLIWSVDRNYRVLVANSAIVEYFRRTYGEEMLIGAAPEDLLPPERAALWPPLFDRALAEGPYQMEYVLADGRVLELAFHPIIQAGEPTGVSVFAKDISGRKRAEQEKEHLRQQLVQAQKMESVGRLAGGVAHDFNNMLTAIIGHSELAMARTAPSDPLHVDLEEIRKAAFRSADLTRQLLAFARKQAVEPRVLDPNDTISGMLRLLRKLIGEDIDLVWKPGAGVWPVEIDPSQVDQVLANLCVNARDAITGVGTVTIETENVVLDEDYCSRHLEAAPGSYVMIAVSDDGCGMDKEVLSRAFEPFFTTKERGVGTGLGLATVYGVARQNEGFVSVYSEPGQGTTFRVYLPRCASNVAPAKPGQIEETPRSRGETILLVEDEASILALGQTMLEHLGYKVLAAARAAEALDVLEKHGGEISLLVTDVIMPDMSGKDLAAKVAGPHPRIPCLYVSGYTAEVVAHRGVLEAGVMLLQKPFTMHALGCKVREAIDGHPAGAAAPS